VSDYIKSRGEATVARRYLRGPQKPNAGGGGRSERRLSATQIGASYTFAGADGGRGLFFEAPRPDKPLAESFRRAGRCFGRSGAPPREIGDRVQETAAPRGLLRPNSLTA